MMALVLILGFSLKAIFDKGLPPVQTIQNNPLIHYPVEYYIMPYTPYTYYITNLFGSAILLYDRNWNYQSYISITASREIRLINNFTYILTNDGFRKFDLNMQLVIFVANINPCTFLRLHYSERTCCIEILKNKIVYLDKIYCSF